MTKCIAFYIRSNETAKLQDGSIYFSVSISADDLPYFTFEKHLTPDEIFDNNIIDIVFDSAKAELIKIMRKEKLTVSK
jgi:hypothetical protein